MAGLYALDQEVAESVKNSTVVEVSSCRTMLRRKKENVNESIKFLGLDKEGIRNLNPKQFKDFMDVKSQIEQQLLCQHQVIVTTCNSSYSSRLKMFNFSRVIIDEAT